MKKISGVLSMEKPEWYYLYSQRYTPYHLYLQDTIPKVFEANGIFVDQSVFDEHLYKHEGEHFFSRITVKVETILKLLTEKQEKGETRPFFFTDVDIVVRPSAETDLQPYLHRTDVDVLFQREDRSSSIANPGVMLLWPTEACQQLWKSVLKLIKERNAMEMHVLNELLATNPPRFDFFDVKTVSCSITILKDNLDTFCIHHLLAGQNERSKDYEEKLFQSKLLGADIERYFLDAIQQYGQQVQ